ncbi:MAG: Sec-independent protein translocase protein TatB [Sphingomonadales bacterium]
MFDIAGTELFLLIILAIIFVGPKDLPRLFRAIGAFMRKARMVARDFQRSFEDIANEADLKDLQDDIKGIKEDVSTKVKSLSDPLDIGDIGGGSKKKTPKKRGKKK